MIYHDPVLLQECIEGLAIKPEGSYVDVTFGGGGHSREILKHLTTGKLVGFDQDDDAINNIPDDPNFIFVKHNFRFLNNFLKYHNQFPVDGILADLGISSHQIDTPERGFSTRFDADLDLRMNVNNPRTAADIVNQYEEADLRKIFHLYGELPNAGKLASTLCASRNNSEIKTTNDLKAAIQHLLPRGREQKTLAMIFQALRIEVNEELEVLQEMLIQGLEALKPGGRFVVMSYHSLEDRLVKNFFKTGNFEGEVKQDFFGNIESPFTVVNRKPIVAGTKELERNPRSRSAKLRIVEKR